MKRMMKIFLAIMLTTQLLPAQQLVDGIAVVVGKEIILRSEIEQYMRNVLMQNRIDPQKNPEMVERIRVRTINSLVEQKLLKEQATIDTITVDPEYVDQKLNERIQYLIQRVGSEEQLEKAFHSPMKKIRKDTRRVLEEQLLVEKVRQSKFQDIKVSRREVEQFYNQFRDSLPRLKESVDISHILKVVKPSAEAQAKAYQKIDSIKALLEAGADFARLAEEESDDPASAIRGGDLGLIGRGEFVPEFETVAFSLNDGQISDIVQTQFGFHIIQMMERRGEKIHTRHILIRVAPTADDEQRVVNELLEIRNKALNDSSFEELAIEYSDDENVKQDHGHLGVFEVDKLVVPQFKSVLEGMKPGEISMPFKTDFGYHIVKLNRHMDARPLSLEEDWQKIEQMAKNFKLEKEYRHWIEDLKKQIPIENRLDG
ncbi:MAG TPA: parvulin peptidyl-prolyl isomerase [Caldithrix abyssi]|uniref:Parvulin peptidyl-prolyl isomerase n=1 Tax=Caldithrix abyssi TaxID=187145 RepID=A0A7V1M239_CALAY|nr:parvulin peptidyl-prolyl isomerase [Caldithrix abyssi]